MRRFLVFSMLDAVAFASGCSGDNNAATPEVQEERLRETESSMEKGMEAMKGMGPKG